MRSLVATALVVSLAVVACSEERVSPSSSIDAGGGTGADGGVGADAGAADGGKGSLSATKTTSTEAILNDVTRTLDRAQFGVTKQGASETFYVEAHEGGVAECPEKETPKRTLIVSDVPKGAAGQSFTKADGVTVSFLDFAGDQITSGQPLTKATAATVTIVAIDEGSSVEIEVDATFAEGTAKGRVYATYCVAMSE
jgi:hypothetical protein